MHLEMLFANISHVVQGKICWYCCLTMLSLTSMETRPSLFRKSQDYIHGIWQYKLKKKITQYDTVLGWGAEWLNSLASGRCGYNLKLFIFHLI